MAATDESRDTVRGEARTMLVCPSCGGQALAAGQFCEQCGAELPAGGRLSPGRRRALRLLFLACWIFLVIMLFIWLVGRAMELKG
jgi:hypothetical protein